MKHTRWFVLTILWVVTGLSQLYASTTYTPGGNSYTAMMAIDPSVPGLVARVGCLNAPGGGQQFTDQFENWYPMDVTFTVTWTSPQSSGTQTFSISALGKHVVGVATHVQALNQPCNGSQSVSLTLSQSNVANGTPVTVYDNKFEPSTDYSSFKSIDGLTSVQYRAHCANGRWVIQMNNLTKKKTYAIALKYSNDYDDVYTADVSATPLTVSPEVSLSPSACDSNPNSSVFLSTYAVAVAPGRPPKEKTK
jgi:hypothetical protein